MNKDAMLDIIFQKLDEIEMGDFSLGSLQDKCLVIKTFAKTLAEDADSSDTKKMRTIEKFNVQHMRGVITKNEFVQKVIETVEEV